MIKKAEVNIRPFRNTRADAEGILAVERVTFAESPYDADQMRALLSEGRQQAWLAVGSEGVVGFAISFLTEGLYRRWWEIDLLAVLPAWRGQRLATRMIRAAAGAGVAQARLARAFTADDNAASVRAFRQAGFREEADLCELLIFRVEDQVLPFRPMAGISIRKEAAGEGLAGWFRNFQSAQDRAIGGSEDAKGAGALHAPGLGPCARLTCLNVLLAERDGQAVGYAELVGVQTLLYRGFWIEALEASDRLVRHALVQEATHQAQLMKVDEIGAMVPFSDGHLRRELLGAGYRSLGSYRQLTAELPLPSPDSEHSGRPEGECLA